MQDLPPWWPTPENLQSAIAATFLIWGREMHEVQVPFRSDSTPAEGVANKLFTTNHRLAPIVLNLVAWAAKANVRVTVEHIAGSANEWADALSRNVHQDLACSPEKRMQVDWGTLWSLNQLPKLSHPDAFWHEYVSELAHEPRDPTLLRGGE